MDEMKNNNEVEELTDVSTEETQGNAFEEPDVGPSKGFVALVVGGIAAIAVGATVAIKRHKKKKAEEEVTEETQECDEEESEDDQKPKVVK